MMYRQGCHMNQAPLQSCMNDAKIPLPLFYQADPTPYHYNNSSTLHPRPGTQPTKQALKKHVPSDI